MKKKRNKRNFADKGIEAFREAIVQHVTSARLVAATQPGEAADPAAIPTVGEEERRQWLADYAAKVASYDVKQLVQESVKYRFQCSAYVIIVPNWHGLREALWVHMKSVGVHKAKRTVSTKDDLISLCVDETIQFDFSDYAKDALSHGNKKSQQLLKQQKLEQSKLENEQKRLAAALPPPPPPPPLPLLPPPPAEPQPQVDEPKIDLTDEMMDETTGQSQSTPPAPVTVITPPVTLQIEQGGTASAISSLPRRPLQPATAETVIKTIKTLPQLEQQQFNAWYQNVWMPQQTQRQQHEHPQQQQQPQQHHPPLHGAVHNPHPHPHNHSHAYHPHPPPPSQSSPPVIHNVPAPLPPLPAHQPPPPPPPHQPHHVQLQQAGR